MSTKAELIAQLDELGIPYPSDATKSELESLLDAPAPTSTSSARPVWDAGESRGEYHARLRAWKLEQRR